MQEFLAKYQELGFSYIPIEYKDKRPALPTWMAYMTRRPTEQEGHAWFGAKERNIGVITGSVSDLAVLDFDDEESYNQFINEIGKLETMIVKTGKGYHVYFRPDIHARTTTFNLNGSLHHIKQEGGYVVAPPSVHYSGRRYEFINNYPPTNIQLGRIAGVLERIGATKYVPDVRERSATWASELCTDITHGERNAKAAQLTGLLIQKFKYDPGLIEGLMNAWNLTYCDPPLGEAPGDDPDELFKIVRGEYMRYGPKD